MRWNDALRCFSRWEGSQLFGGSHSAITIYLGALNVWLLNTEIRSLRYQNDKDEAFEEAFDRMEQVGENSVTSWTGKDQWLIIAA